MSDGGKLDAEGERRVREAVVYVSEYVIDHPAMNAELALHLGTMSVAALVGINAEFEEIEALLTRMAESGAVKLREAN